MSPQAQDRRRRYFIDRGFQGRYVALLVVFVICLGVAGLLILLVGGAEPAGPEARSDLLSAITAMLMVILVFVAFTIWYGLRFSHRLIGPIYAFNRHLTWIREGNYTRDLKLREKDEFQNLAAAFNLMQSTLRQRMREGVDAQAHIETGLAELAGILGEQGFDRERAGELIKRLRAELEAVRVKEEGYITP